VTPKLASCREEAVGKGHSNGHIRPSFAFILNDQSTAFCVKPDLKQFTLIQQERDCRLYDENLSMIGRFRACGVGREVRSLHKEL
jgi:hypothetical protein